MGLITDAKGERGLSKDRRFWIWRREGGVRRFGGGRGLEGTGLLEGGAEIEMGGICCWKCKGRVYEQGEGRRRGMREEGVIYYHYKGIRVLGRDIFKNGGKWRRNNEGKTIKRDYGEEMELRMVLCLKIGDLL